MTIENTELTSEELEQEFTEALDILGDVLYQACGTDSMAISAFARGFRFLEKHKKFKMTVNSGRRVIGDFTYKIV